MRSSSYLYWGDKARHTLRISFRCLWCLWFIHKIGGWVHQKLPLLPLQHVFPMSAAYDIDKGNCGIMWLCYARFHYSIFSAMCGFVPPLFVGEIAIWCDVLPFESVWFWTTLQDPEECHSICPLWDNDVKLSGCQPRISRVRSHFSISTLSARKSSACWGSCPILVEFWTQCWWISTINTEVFRLFSSGQCKEGLGINSMARRVLLWAGARVCLQRPTLSTTLQKQQQVVRPQLFSRNFSSQRGQGPSTSSSSEHVHFRWFSRILSSGKQKAEGVPYFPVILGFTATGCFGAGLFVVLADAKGSPAAANAGGII